MVKILNIQNPIHSNVSKSNVEQWVDKVRKRNKSAQNHQKSKTSTHHKRDVMIVPVYYEDSVILDKNTSCRTCKHSGVRKNRQY